MKIIYSPTKVKIICRIALVLSFAANVAAQSPVGDVEDTAGAGWLLQVILVVAAGLGGAFYLWQRSKKGDPQIQYNYDNRSANYYENERYELLNVDAEKEMEWFRKVKKTSATASKSSLETKKPAANGHQKLKKRCDLSETSLDTKAFQEKMRKLQYEQLPINSYRELSPSKRYQPLPLSNDTSLLSAVEQANEECEEDEAIREVSVRVLAAFRTRNSVEALSQIALYDLSSNLRSKAVSTLTEFDHESVFEAILLACADPTREVRAAAARGLFLLDFDRADAWKRIIETNDEFRMSQAARAAIESGIVAKSFERLVHEDLKIAYEAFALVSLLIKSGETEEIFEAIKTHSDTRVRFSLLHVLNVRSEKRTLSDLQRLGKDGGFPDEVAERIQETISSFESVMV